MRFKSCGKLRLVSSRDRLAGLALVGLASMLLVLAASWRVVGQPTASGDVTVTLIHIGDLHGHLMPRPDVRSDATGRTAGGLARMHARIEEIRARAPNPLLINTGDTIQGSAEVLFTRGQAIVDVLDMFRIDYFTPGNWDFVYGSARFLELFGGIPARWGTTAANVYFDGEPYAAQTGRLALPPFHIREIAGVKLGILGLTTRRGPQVVGRGVTKGLRFTSGDEEVPRYLKELRETHKVDAVILLSEQELANNIRLAETYPGIDVILSSDMHEATRQPIRTANGTVIVEEGQDGMQLGELALQFGGKKLIGWKWAGHRIDERIQDSPAIAARIAEVRRSFVAGPDFVRHRNPFNGLHLARPIDTVVGETAVALHRSNFAGEAMPAVIEGTSHNFLTDAFRAVAGADVGAIRGFRYGTHVPPGLISMEDLYHFIPIGPMIAKGTVKGRQLKAQLESSVEGALSPSVKDWTGGWLFNFSGLTASIDPAAPKGQSATAIRIRRADASGFADLDLDASYTYASYYYAAEPSLINAIPATDIDVLKDESGAPLDGVEVVVRYLATRTGKRVDPGPPRLSLVRPLPRAKFGNPEIQPLRGVVAE